MLLPLVTVTSYDVILMLRESAPTGLWGLAFISRIYSAPGRSIACWRFPEGARTYDNAAGATNFGNPRLAK